MIYKVSVGVHITINYDAVEADTIEEAEAIARHNAMHDTFVSAKCKNNIDTNECGTSIYRCDPIVEEDE